MDQDLQQIAQETLNSMGENVHRHPVPTRPWQTQSLLSGIGDSPESPERFTLEPVHPPEELRETLEAASAAGARPQIPPLWEQRVVEYDPASPRRPQALTFARREQAEEQAARIRPQHPLLFAGRERPAAAAQASPAPGAVLPPLRTQPSQPMAASQPSSPASDPKMLSEALKPAPDGVHLQLWVLSGVAEAALRAPLLTRSEPGAAGQATASGNDPETSVAGQTTTPAAAPQPPPTPPPSEHGPPPMSAPVVVPNPPPTPSSQPLQPTAPAAGQTTESAPVAARRPLPTLLPRPIAPAATEAAEPASRLKKTTSGRITKPVPDPGQKKSNRDAAEEKTFKTSWEKTKGELLAEDEYGNAAEAPCNHCRAGGRPCRVAVNPLWYGSYKCSNCVRNKVSCSHDSAEKQRAARAATGKTPYPQVVDTIKARMTVKRPPPKRADPPPPASAAPPAAAPPAAAPAAESPATKALRERQESLDD